MTEPTNKELDAVIKHHRTRIYPQDMQPHFERAIMRAVLAKWGQPAQAQAVSMTSRQINDARCADLDPDDRPEPWAFTQGVRAAEKHHGIKGGQHEPKQMG